MCGPECQERPIHRAECTVRGEGGTWGTLQVLARAGVRPRPQVDRETGEEMEEDKDHPIYECVSALRVCLLLQERRERRRGGMGGRGGNWSVVESLARHREERAAADNAKYIQHNVVRFLMKHARLEEAIPGITEDDITR